MFEAKLDFIVKYGKSYRFVFMGKKPQKLVFLFIICFFICYMYFDFISFR